MRRIETGPSPSRLNVSFSAIGFNASTWARARSCTNTKFRYCRPSPSMVSASPANARLKNAAATQLSRILGPYGMP